MIKRAREERNLTQKELAARCENISDMYISQIEKGDRIPSIRICRLLARALDLDEDRLLILAHNQRAPKEIRNLLVKEESSPYGRQSDDQQLLNLARAASKLPPQKRKDLTKLWEDSFKIILGGFNKTA